ncbi:DUF3907 family protein [Bacillus horti]|uniref:DUF3907 family protein n=1 Tax=Caldalkalibacillus horti TaxID=77523 RepID=A0ABT9VUY4_9BACI|nr:DUF3907 family protein [Bacillus horti]MDQ0164786.1 hypothetical protein [Bacillus horti]
MPTFILMDMCEMTYQRLKQISATLENYLNHVHLPMLMESDDHEEETYYKGYLQDLRHLLINCENSYEKLGVSLRRAQFNKEFSEEALYQAYHLCVNGFFYPKNESYEEDGRHSYTGRDAIIFRREVNPELKKITLELSKVFEKLRDDLMYYETDYVTTKRMKS